MGGDIFRAIYFKKRDLSKTLAENLESKIFWGGENIM